MLLLLSGCQGGGATAIHKAEKVIAADLTDPGSAQFRNVRVAQTGLVCGEVNAKNQFGGYVGFRQFAYADGKRQHFVDEGAASRQTTVCAGGLCCNGMKFTPKAVEIDANADVIVAHAGEGR